MTTAVWFDLKGSMQQVRLRVKQTIVVC